MWLLVALAPAAALDLDGDAVRRGHDRCPWRRETWNYHDDDDGCPDGVTVRIVVIDEGGQPAAGARVSVTLNPPARPGPPTPLWCPPGKTWDALNQPWRLRHRYRVESYLALEARADDRGVADFAGVRPGADLTVTVNEGRGQGTVQLVTLGEHMVLQELTLHPRPAPGK
ncbi:MAG: hypothetical protein V4850_12855 [Myxococcota bacterium]